VPQDFVQAARWYRQAADQGLALAALALGKMYGSGRGVPQDFMQAHVWLNLAAAGLPPGKDQAMAVKLRDGLAKLMTPEQLAEAQRQASEWQPKVPEPRPLDREWSPGSP
jgi:uncharacterized protein